MHQYNPAIIVVAFNRPRSLKRLLSSLQHAKKINNAKLIISIDNFEPHNLNIKELAEAFIWPFGEKEVIYHKQRLGLRKHILQCGDLTEKYGSVIILEDDLFVSPYFFDYSVKALEYYSNDAKIAGISLYNQPYEETSRSPFSPIDDGSDVYFVQFPSSLGQAWTHDQWRQFKSWYNENPDLATVSLPPKVLKWPETSWKKYFCAYMTLSNRYFVYPRISLTTNFNDPGTHVKQLVNHDGQVQLRLFDVEYVFIPYNKSQCIYDVYFELQPECVKSFTEALKQYSFELDLYGHKDLSKVNAPYVITCRPVKKSLHGFKRALKPHELNIIFELSGDDFFLSQKEDVLSFKELNTKKIADYKYFYHKNLIGWRVLLSNYFSRFKHK